MCGLRIRTPALSGIQKSPAAGRRAALFPIYEIISVRHFADLISQSTRQGGFQPAIPLPPDLLRHDACDLEAARFNRRPQINLPASPAGPPDVSCPIGHRLVNAADLSPDFIRCGAVNIQCHIVPYRHRPSQIRAAPDLLAASATALATAGPTRLSKALGMM